MEERKLKKRHLKWRILKKIFLILVVSMILSTLIGFAYFEAVVRNQTISDEQIKLQQVSNQIVFMTEDIEKFAQSILVDRELQELLEEEEYESEFERQSTYDRIAKRLSFYNGLRTYIDNSMIEMENGTCYGTSYVEMNTDYIEKKLQREEMVRYEEGDFVYSDPYLEDPSKEKKLICYKIQMWDKRHFGFPEATLYLEIDLEYFLEQVRLYSVSYDNVCLLGNEQTILYDQDSKEIIKNYLKEGNVLPEEGVCKIKEGYLLCDSVEEAGWKLCTLVTHHYLWQRSQFVLIFFLLSFLISTGLISIFIIRTMEGIIQPVEKLSRQMEKIEYGKFEMIEMVHTGDEIETLYERFAHMLSEIKKGAQERDRYEKQKKEMEFDIMLSQINPHYLYNVLNTVVYMAAAKKEKEIVTIVRSLIYTLQETLQVGENNVETTIEKELEFTRNYLTIQAYRYPDFYTVTITCEKELEQCLIPKIMIQPLVENAILHGILPQECFGEISVRIFKEDEILKIIVEDNGIGISEECLERFAKGESVRSKKSKRKHIGISNVRDRIRYLYGEPYGMKICKKKEKGTIVLLSLPFVKEAQPTEKKNTEDVGERKE